MVALVGFAAVGAVGRTVVVLTVAGVLGIPLGWWVGERWFSALSAEAFRRLVLAFLAVTAVVAAYTALR